ncbi:MAG: hypothetical protein HY000_31035 [Planctomycetes bacterium]|nr:hypothetical protein [Planctomycetota bacterium]
MIEVRCPLCGDVWEVSGLPASDSAAVVECPQCGHAFDVEPPAAQVERFDV